MINTPAHQHLCNTTDNNEGTQRAALSHLLCKTCKKDKAQVPHWDRFLVNQKQDITSVNKHYKSVQIAQTNHAKVVDGPHLLQMRSLYLQIPLNRQIQAPSCDPINALKIFNRLSQVPITHFRQLPYEYLHLARILSWKTTSAAFGNCFSLRMQAELCKLHNRNDLNTQPTHTSLKLQKWP